MAYFDRKDDYGYVCWADQVRRRDHYTCDICGRRGIPVNAHHMNAWASFPDQRYDISNGVTLCVDCHTRFHEIYGKGKNTKEQFEEYKSIAESMIKIANDESLMNATVRKMTQQVQRDQAVESILKDLEEKYGNTEEDATDGGMVTSTDIVI